MRRGGDTIPPGNSSSQDHPILPPPEFQDLPVLPPPPVLFRDLSPSNPCLPSSSSSDPQTVLFKKCIKEFADKISFNILNEAMVIATLIPAGSINDVRSQSSTPSFPINSDTCSSNTLSTETSWEYLNKSNSLSDLTKIREQHNFPIPPHRGRIEKKLSRRKSCGQQDKKNNRLKKSNSDALSSSSPNQQITAGMNAGAKLPYFNTPKVSKDCCPSATKAETDDLDLCYNVPFQCDIYSLPVDSIKSTPQSNQGAAIVSSSSSTSNCNRRSQLKRVSKVVNDENEHTRSVSLHEDILTIPTATTTRTNETKEKTRGVVNRCSSESSHRNSNRTNKSPVVGDDHEADKVVETTTKNNPSARLTERNNNENVTPTNNDKMRWNKKRCSRSVDIDNQNSLNQRKLIQSSEAQSSEREFSSSKEKKNKNFGHTILNLFRRNRPQLKTVQLPSNNDSKIESEREIVLVSRALPLPPSLDSDCIEQTLSDSDEHSRRSRLEPRDFAASIEKVKDCGWYWGPLASDRAEDLLRSEPDGSFIVRDSSDDHYIFSLTFKLNGLVRHVRIEHDQGNFSFGPLTRFKASTIIEFVEKAVAHSRSGRYLFFLHKRPVLGPLKLSLPYSRFRHPRSLKHMCRFVILKYVRRDLLNTLPLPSPIQDYLNTPHYY